MCLPACASSTAASSKAGSIRPQVHLPAPHTTLTAGRCRLSLDLWNSKFFSIVFNVNLTDSARVKAVIDGYGKDHPAQTRWQQDQTWDPGCIVAYWAKQPDNDALSTAELALKSWSLFAVACWPRCSDGARLVRSSIKFS